MIYTLPSKKHKPPRLKCGLCVVTSFQRVQYQKGGKHNFMVEKADKPYLKVVKVNINSE